MPREFLALGVLVLVASAALAQPQVGPVSRPPAVSPYLNLLRPGNSPGYNYYGLVKPQMEFRSGLQDLQQQVLNNQGAISDLNNATLPATGHRTSFLNTGGYYSGRARGTGTTSFGSAPRVGNAQGAGTGPGPRQQQNTAPQQQPPRR
jgi:hypothetical protein